MLNKVTIEDIDVKGKKVLLRCDYNVPIVDGKITDENRITAELPTVKKLLSDGARLIMCSHLGKPKGADEAFTLRPVAERLSELLGQEVKFIPSPTVVDDEVRAAADALQPGEAMLLENTRFRKEETKNEEAFSKDLADICDIFVNDAFGTAHRAHCSNVGVAALKDVTAIGYLMEKEVNFLGNAVESPERPFAAILGGSKVSSKISVINNLLEKVDILVIGGGMAYTFLKAMGQETGKSLLEEEYIDYAKEMMEKAAAKNVKLLLPVDHLTVKEFDNDAPSRITKEIAEDEMAVDIGPETIELFSAALKDAKTIVWNGPMGVFEKPNFAKGTYDIAKLLSELDAVTIIGGGDSASAVNNLGFGDAMTHISTGGGASLEFLEGKALPGIEAVQDK